MPLHSRPDGPVVQPSTGHPSRTLDPRAGPYEAGYRVMRGYEAAPPSADAPAPAAWFGGRSRDGR